MGDVIFSGVLGMALTLTRKRRRIEESYRINGIRQRREQPPGSDFDHDRHSGGTAKVDLGVERIGAEYLQWGRDNAALLLAREQRLFHLDRYIG